MVQLAADHAEAHRSGISVILGKGWYQLIRERIIGSISRREPAVPRKRIRFHSENENQE
jgi:hypothetical protein